MSYNEKFARAVYMRDVPGDKLGEYMEMLAGKPEAEKQKLLTQIAIEIESTYPYKKGREPEEET